MTKQEFFELADRYSMYQCSQEEAKLFEGFCNELHDTEILKSWDTDELESTRIRLLSKLNDHAPIKQAWKRTERIFPWKIAASIVLILSLSWLVYNRPKTEVIHTIDQLVQKSTSEGQKLNIVLPDGSKVKLNARSSLSYSENFTQSTREVFLKGEGFFEVVKDTGRPFKVVTENISTTVLGTSFNVKANLGDQDIKVTVATGKVKVAVNNSTRSDQLPVILEPSEQAVFNLGLRDIAINTVELYEALAWKDNRIIFNNTTLQEASKELEKWFDVEILYTNEKLKECRFSNEFVNESLEDILKEFKFIFNIDYKISEGNHIILSGNGCRN